MFDQFPVSLTYDDVSLVPRVCSEIRSRSIPNLNSVVCLKPYTELRLPVIASPMDTVCNADMATVLNFQGGVGIIHRFQTIAEQLHELNKFFIQSENIFLKYPTTFPIIDFTNIGIAVGITGDYKKRLQILLKNYTSNVSYFKEKFFKTHKNFRLWILFDTANGFHIMMKEAIDWFCKESGLYDENEHIIFAGNIASKEGFKFLSTIEHVGIARVGISNGSPCTTGMVSGVGQGIVTTIRECYEERLSINSHISIVADGGIRQSGDIAKALALGADAVMCGSLLAGFDESPGRIITDGKGNKIKTYRGMASHTAADIMNKINQTTKQIIPEGIEHYVPYKGNVDSFLSLIRGGVCSAMSYLNASDLVSMRQNASFVKLTYFSHIERTPFIANNGINKNDLIEQNILQDHRGNGGC